jgi:O-Antigen ligase
MRRTFPAALAFAAIGYAALESGGFFATSWGWPTIAFLLTAASVVLVAERLRLGRTDLLLLLALAGFVCWTALSALWTPGAELPIQGAQLALVYLAGAAAFLLLDSVSLPLGIVCAITPLAAYALATRLVPDHVGTYDPTAGGYLLAGPTGYQNCLGILCALAVLIALGLATHGPRLRVRIGAALALVILLPTLYFTFSRGGAAALILGVLCTIAIERKRLTYSLTLLAALPLPLLGVWLCSRSGPLTRAGSPLSAAAHDGHRLVAVLAVLAVLQVAVIAMLARLEHRVTLTPSGRRAYSVGLAVVGAVVIAAGLVRTGDPVAFVSHATDAFTTETAASGGDLNRRLVTLSGHSRSQYWRVAWREVRENPVLGGGGETFQRYWLRDRSTPIDVLNTHNLYLETLAELGPLGLLLLLGALAAPLLAVRKALGHRFTPVVAGAYVAALAHATVDWDWQLPAVTLCTLALGTTLIIAARRSTDAHVVTARLRWTTIPLTLGLIAFVFAAQVGHNALAAAERAANHGDYRAALADARSARSWLPWAASPWQRIGEAQLASGEPAAAKSSLREAIRLDRSDWSTWLDLALTSTDGDRRRALAQVACLNPLSQEATKSAESLHERERP